MHTPPWAYPHYAHTLLKSPRSRYPIREMLARNEQDLRSGYRAKGTDQDTGHHFILRPFKLLVGPD